MLHKFSCFLLSSPARLPCVLHHAAQVDISEQNTCCTGYMQMASLLYVFVHDSEDVSSVQNACYTGCMKTLFHLHVSLSYEHAGTAAVNTSCYIGHRQKASPQNVSFHGCEELLIA